MDNLAKKASKYNMSIEEYKEAYEKISKEFWKVINKEAYRLMVTCGMSYGEALFLISENLKEE